MAMTPEQLQQARTANLPVLSLLANQPGNQFSSTTAPLIAFVSMVNFFFGFFIGTVEMINGLLVKLLGKGKEGERIIIVSLFLLLFSAAGVAAKGTECAVGHRDDCGASNGSDTFFCTCIG